MRAPSFLGVVCIGFTVFYISTVREIKRGCAHARADSLARGRAAADEAYAEYTGCAWDTLPHESCGLPARNFPADDSGAGISPRRVADNADVWRSRVHVYGSDGLVCALVQRLPDPLAAVFAEAAPIPAPDASVRVVISRTRLAEFDHTLDLFRRQCDCGWPWWRWEANFDYKVTYEFVRSGLDADAFADEMRRAPSFYARFGGAVETWVASVRGGLQGQMMSDSGTLQRFEKRYASIIMRYILVIYSPPGTGTGDGATGSIWSALLSAGGSGDSDAQRRRRDTSAGTFTVAMSEVQLTSWPTGDCDCAHDQALHQRMRETVDARMKKHFADTASHLIRASPDPFDSTGADPSYRGLASPSGVATAAVQTDGDTDGVAIPNTTSLHTQSKG